MKYEHDTIIAPITPVVGGSVALIRISGKNAINFTNELFKGKTLLKQEGGRFYHGQMINERSELIDDVVVFLYRKPHSYTGEDIVEISAHGNPFIVEEILQQYLAKGCRIAQPGEFSRRAFLNGKMDLIQAEAVADLIAAKSKAIAKNSLQNIKGKLSYLVSELKEQLVQVASLLELDLDFTEDDLDIISSDQINDVLDRVLEKVNSLLESYNYSKILSKGIEALITGKTNVGKSSLMNALLERDRVIVSSMPGTTRDFIHEDIVIKNVLVRFIDSAGIRFAKNRIEAAGVDRAKELYDRSDIILLVIDASKRLSKRDYDLLELLSSQFGNKLIVLANKKDLLPNQNTTRFLDNLELEVQHISAKTGENLDLVKERIIDKIHTSEKDLSEEVLISNERQKGILLTTRENLLLAKEALSNNVGYEFIAVDIRNAINSLSEISGQITSEDILNNIFSNFCIGK
jgi:tRNA modification GTPase